MKLKEIFRANELPIFQNKTFSTRDNAIRCLTGNIALVQDLETGLIFNSVFDPDLVVYDEDYQNEQACSSAFQAHLDSVTKIIHRHFHGKSLIEVGCGKGYFLERLDRLGYDVTGIDPAYEGTNPRVVRAPFEEGLGLASDAVILRHVLEHVRDPVSFLSSVAKANAGQGDIYIEVPCFDWICRQRAWFDIFYEHVNYFRLVDLNRMFGTVRESGRIFGDQYLYVVADLGTLRVPRCEHADEVTFPEDFLGSIGNFAGIARERSINALWGGASKGVIFAIYMERAGIDFELAIDINPAKQGRYLPKTGVRVFSPGEAMKVLNDGDNLFVMNSNYVEEIVKQSNSRYNYIAIDK